MTFFSHATVPTRTMALLAAFALSVLLFFPLHSFAVFGTALNSIADGFLWASENIVGMAQFVFLLIIQETVLEFGQFWNNNSTAGLTLQSVWQVVRDIVNLLIVVLFVIVTIMTVFGEFVFKRKVLIGLILAAILVNFSAFFVLFVIDISNILFVMFFNLLNIGQWGSLSPFSGLGTGGMIVQDAGWNFGLSVVIFATSFFIFAGLLYFCIILAERFIIAILLVIGSPILTVGFFLKTFGASGSLTQPFITAYEKGKERLFYIFSTPVLLLFGFFVILLVFDTIIGDTAQDVYVAGRAVPGSPDQVFPQVMQILLACLLLVYGMFKVGSIAQNANILGKDGFHLFGKDWKFGEFLKNRASNLANPRRTLRGAFINSVGRIQTGEGQSVADRLGRVPFARAIVGKSKPLSDPSNRVGRALRRARGIGEAVESGAKMYKDKEMPLENLRDFEAAYKDFTRVNQDTREGWSARKQRNYRNLRNRLEEIMNDPEKKARSMSNKFFVEDNTSQMQKFTSGGDGDDGGGDGARGFVTIGQGGGVTGGTVESAGRREEREERRNREQEAQAELAGARTTLNVGENASWDDVQQAHRNLLRHYSGYPEAEREEQIRNLNAAYATLRRHHNNQ